MELKTFYLNNNHDFTLHELIYCIPYAWVMPEPGEYIDVDGSVTSELPVDVPLVIKNLSEFMEENKQ